MQRDYYLNETRWLLNHSEMNLNIGIQVIKGSYEEEIYIFFDSCLHSFYSLILRCV